MLVEERNMGIQVKKTPKVVEKNFNFIKSQLNDLILNKKVQPPDDLFNQLDIEFQKVKEYYERIDDQINLLHVEHNYLWSKAVQFLNKDPTESLSLLIKAISKLLERNKHRPYSTTAFENMLKAYKLLINKN